MPSFPTSTYSPRVRENRPGVVYDANKKTVLFVEDLTNSDNEIIALETNIKFPSSAPGSPVAGASYFDQATNMLYIYNGAGWKSVELT